MNISGIGGSTGGNSPSVVSGASGSGGATKKMTTLFDQIDNSGTGSISKSQLEQAFQTQNPPAAFKALGSDKLFQKLDPQGTGSVSKQSFVSTMAQLSESFRQAASSGTSSTGATLNGASQSLHNATSSTDGVGRNINVQV